jgi:hypothetical protein
MQEADSTSSSPATPFHRLDRAIVKPRSWFHTTSLGILFVLLAIIADSIGATGQDAEGRAVRTVSTAR